MESYPIRRHRTIADAVHEAVNMATNVRDDIVRHVRSLVDIWRGVPIGSEAEERLYRDIRAEMEALRGIDLDTAAELEMEILDANAGPPDTWAPRWDRYTWIPSAEVGGIDLSAGIGAGETDSNEGEDDGERLHPEPPVPDSDAQEGGTDLDAGAGFAPPDDDEPRPTILPEPAPDDDGGARTDLAGWVAAQAQYYFSLGTAAGDLVASVIDDLHAALLATHASTPGQARDRMELLAMPAPVAEFWTLAAADN